MVLVEVTVDRGEVVLFRNPVVPDAEFCEEVLEAVRKALDEFEGCREERDVGVGGEHE